MSDTKDVVLGHSDEADGLEEYDNKMPNWWLGIFYVSILWGGWYAVNYHFVAQTSQTAQFDAEMAAAKAQWPEPEAVAAGSGPGDVEAGKAVYAQNCIGCHGPALKGGIGPDLTDGTWIHGGTLPQIQAVITKGVPEKGMLTWGPILGPQKVAAVAAYIHAAGGGQ